MKQYDLPGLKRERKPSRKHMSEDEFNKRVTEVDRKLLQKMRENEIREAQSLLYAGNFVTTPPLDD